MKHEVQVTQSLSATAMRFIYILGYRGKLLDNDMVWLILQTSTRKQFHGNDLIFSGNGDGDSECIPWNEDLCPTDANNEDALIVPTTDRTRSKPIEYDDARYVIA